MFNGVDTPYPDISVTPSGHEGKEFLRAAAVAAMEKMKDRKEYFAGQARLFALILGRSIGYEGARAS